MSRLLVEVEGQTEEIFVNELVAPHLWSHGYHYVGARLLGNARQRLNRGGVKPWHQAKSDIVRHLLEDQQRIVTTMVDYYALPGTGSKAWPGRDAAPLKPVSERAAHVQAAMQEDLQGTVGLAANRFVPFVVMHEFEGLLFSDPKRFAEEIGHSNAAGQFAKIAGQFSSPEEINDSPETAPSKRVLKIVPAYQKVLHGNSAAKGIGLETIRKNCPNFSSWIAKFGLHPVPKTRP